MSTIDLQKAPMDDILQKLDLFEPITLEEMDNFRLMDRLDTKFIFTKERLPLLLEEMKNGYRILEVNGLRNGRYATRYFDTPDFRLYLNHHNGKLSRFKIRYRKYIDSDITFFEIKLKRNTGRMIKNRVQVNDLDDLIRGPAEELLIKKTALPSDRYKPVLDVFFSRMTFVNRNSNERLTIDTGLHYRNSHGELSFPHLVIAEIKQEKSGISPFISLMHCYHIRELSVSKYCLGIASLVDGIKKNNFKFKLSQINSTDHEGK